MPATRAPTHTDLIWLRDGGAASAGMRKRNFARVDVRVAL
jgi:hypothetical protein